jgi:hypothetical protein
MKDDDKVIKKNYLPLCGWKCLDKELYKC